MPSTSYIPSIHGDTSGVYWASDPSANGISFNSTDLFTLNVMSSNDYSVTWCSTAASATPRTPVKIYTPEPVDDTTYCIWCGSEWFPSKSYPGNCNSCGGPRKYKYMPRKSYK